MQLDIWIFISTVFVKLYVFFFVQFGISLYIHFLVYEGIGTVLGLTICFLF